MPKRVGENESRVERQAAILRDLCEKIIYQAAQKLESVIIVAPNLCVGWEKTERQKI